MKKVVIYTSPTCAPCRMAKGYMDYHNIGYTEIDISKEQSPDAIKSCPTIVCGTGNDADEILSFEGFSQGIGNKINRWYND